MVAGVASTLLLAGCPSMLNAESASVEEPLNQSIMCVVVTDEEALTCPEGEVFYGVFSGINSNEMALGTAALYCDFNYPVVHNDAGVVCVMTRNRIHLVEQAVQLRQEAFVQQQEHVPLQDDAASEASAPAVE